MGSETVGPPAELALYLRDQLGLVNFFETGTWQGNTTRWAAPHFQKVITVEASKHFFDNVQESFRPFQNITSLFGDSGEQVGSLVSTLAPTLFFLDAHWSAGDTAGEESECPLLTELGLILPWFRKHAIMIDDARLFLQPPYPPHRIAEWPSLDDIVRATNGLAYVVYYRDVLVLVPNIHRPPIAEGIRNLRL